MAQGQDLAISRGERSKGAPELLRALVGLLYHRASREVFGRHITYYSEAVFKPDSPLRRMTAHVDAVWRSYKVPHRPPLTLGALGGVLAWWSEVARRGSVYTDAPMDILPMLLGRTGGPDLGRIARRLDAALMRQWATTGTRIDGDRCGHNRAQRRQYVAYHRC